MPEDENPFESTDSYDRRDTPVPQELPACGPAQAALHDHQIEELLAKAEKHEKWLLRTIRIQTKQGSAIAFHDRVIWGVIGTLGLTLLGIVGYLAKQIVETLFTPPPTP